MTWIKDYVSTNDNVEEGDFMMSGALTGCETRYRYDESRGRDVELWEEYPRWDSLEGRMVELGLS